MYALLASNARDAIRSSAAFLRGAQSQRIVRIAPRHERPSPVLVGDLIDLAYPIVDARLGRVVPGVVELGADQGLGQRGERRAALVRREQARAMLIENGQVAAAEIMLRKGGVVRALAVEETRALALGFLDQAEGEELGVARGQ